MCGFFTIGSLEIFLNFIESREKYKQLELFEGKLTNAFSKEKIPVIHKKRDKMEVDLFQWSLVPSKSKEKDVKFSTYNSRCEDIFKKATWKNPIKRSRCVIPVKFFIEWYHLDINNKKSKKYPFKIFLKNKPDFLFGGIWDYWKSEDKSEELFSFSIITTPGNELMNIIHNTKQRMPLIIDEKDIEKWIYTNSENEIKNLMKRYPSELMDAYSIDKEFKRSNNFDEIIENDLKDIYEKIKK